VPHGRELFGRAGAKSPALGAIAGLLAAVGAGSGLVGGVPGKERLSAENETSGLRRVEGTCYVQRMPLSDVLRSELGELVRSNRVVLFMKGTRDMPQCGFSATVVRLLDELGSEYATVDVLARHEIRDGIKEFTNWPTIPQLYVGGEFVGGSDIVRELHASGELAKLLGVTVAEVKVPAITVSPAAAKAFLDARESDADFVRLEISAKFGYDLFFGPKQPGDVEVDAGGLTLLLDRGSARRADGMAIDFVEGPGGAGFKIDNPNEPPKVATLTAAELKAMMDKGPVELYDVRTEQERAIATIAGARHLDGAGRDRLEELDKATPVVFHCHHGVRSLAAAEHYLARGFKKVFNLKGGIDAWSASVDPSVPRY
jgi:monothiol glutaredoxin